MSAFIDIPGASGAAYRFLRMEIGALPASGGAVIVVQPSARAPKVLLYAAAASLAATVPSVRAAVRGRSAAQVYMRRNVTRAARQAEQDDIVAAVEPAEVLGEP